MIKNNNFTVKNLKHVVFQDMRKFADLELNKKSGIKTEIITSSDQAKLIPKKLDFKVFDNVNDEFKNI